MDDDDARESQCDKSACHRLAVELAVRAQPYAASEQQHSKDRFRDPVQWHSVDSRRVRCAPLCKHDRTCDGVIVVTLRA